MTSCSGWPRLCCCLDIVKYYDSQSCERVTRHAGPGSGHWRVMRKLRRRRKVRTRRHGDWTLTQKWKFRIYIFPEDRTQAGEIVKVKTFTLKHTEYIPVQLEIQYLWSHALFERVGSLLVFYEFTVFSLSLAPNFSVGNKSCRIFGGKSSGTSGGCNRISWYPPTWGLTSNVTDPRPKYWLIPFSS